MGEVPITGCEMRCTDNLLIQICQAVRRCVILKVRKEGFMEAAAFEPGLEPGLEWVKCDVGP